MRNCEAEVGMRRIGWGTAALLALACGGTTNGNDGDDDDTTLDGSGGTEATSTTVTSVTDEAGATGSTNATESESWVTSGTSVPAPQP
jgi:hypothetical protein